jgi:hypothetical protein
MIGVGLTIRSKARLLHPNAKWIAAQFRQTAGATGQHNHHSEATNSQSTMSIRPLRSCRSIIETPHVQLTVMPFEIFGVALSAGQHP